MRALTLTQPWAGLVASGIKLVENRPRSIIKREDFGKPFAIHASRENDRAAWRRIIEIDPTLALDHPGPMARAAGWQRLAGVLSAVIAVATIDSVVIDDTDDYGRHTIAAILGDQNRWFLGPIGYVLRDVRALATAVPCRGFQGFWTLPVDVAQKVEAQL